jgi:hypothetical protein
VVPPKLLELERAVRAKPVERSIVTYDYVVDASNLCSNVRVAMTNGYQVSVACGTSTQGLLEYGVVNGRGVIEDSIVRGDVDDAVRYLEAVASLGGDASPRNVAKWANMLPVAAPKLAPPATVKVERPKRDKPRLSDIVDVTINVVPNNPNKLTKVDVGFKIDRPAPSQAYSRSYDFEAAELAIIERQTLDPLYAKFDGLVMGGLVMGRKVAPSGQNPIQALLRAMPKVDGLNTRVEADGSGSDANLYVKLPNGYVVLVCWMRFSNPSGDSLECCIQDEMGFPRPETVVKGKTIAAARVWIDEVSRRAPIGAGGVSMALPPGEDEKRQAAEAEQRLTTTRRKLK